MLLLVVWHWGQIGVNARTLGWGHVARNPYEFRDLGQVGQESNLQPAVLETQSDVSGGVGRYRQVPLCPTLNVVVYR